MQWSLILLSLMGQCSFFTCQLYDYRFIKENKTWDEAQKHCRKNYTDLATVSNMTDMKRVINSTESQDEAWIGLHSYPGNGSRKWHWSLPGVEFNESETRWESGEPNDYNGHLENCALMTNKNWSDFPCTASFKFICYNGTNQSKKTCHVISDKLSWSQAQNYCRVNHTDLISGLDQLDHCAESGSDMSGTNMWIGLFRDTWRWSDGSSFSFRYWESLSANDLVEGQGDKKCATTVLNRAGKWNFDYCNNTKPFICYSDKVILVNESKTWVEALNYCRKNHQDLVSITNLDEQRWVQERAKNASSLYVWLGLRYSCTLDFWFWVTDNRVKYTNWAPKGHSNDCDMSAAMEKAGQNQWFKKPDNEKFNFICF
ncbi:C-type mannose receptor 2 [Channa argus]|uniref:C-type mannose receptor 2 n=1 Tax=Channa argus TaxID=215402 RepID=A0A6G1Q5I0_CHAAH|nr:C-type mannose receptor 2 [Channa argus]